MLRDQENPARLQPFRVPAVVQASPREAQAHRLVPCCKYPAFPDLPLGMQDQDLSAGSKTAAAWSSNQKYNSSPRVDHPEVRRPAALPHWPSPYSVELTVQ